MSGKSGSIPSWQRTASPSSPTEANPDVPATASDGKPEGDAEVEAPKEGAAVLKEQAAKFLQDPSIKDASKERKAAFLESKGIQKADIESLLEDDGGDKMQIVRCDDID
jgi:hypothetical protein